MTASMSTYNESSILTLERTVQNVIDKYAADIIPLSDLCYDWTRLNRMFDTTLRQFEQYLPCLKWYVAPRIREFVMPEDCQEVRSAVLYTPNILWTDMPLLVLGTDYTYNKFQNKVSSYLSGLAIQYLAKYTTKSHTVTTETFDISPCCVTEFSLEFVPKPNSMQLIDDSGLAYTLTPIMLKQDRMEFKFHEVYGGQGCDILTIDLNTMKCTIETTIETETFTLLYDSKYNAIYGLDSGAEFFETMFASRLLSGLGNAKAVCKFESMPNDITADNLTAIATKLEEEVASHSKSKWWLGISAIN